MAAFVKGFADSEGYVGRDGFIRIVNTDIQLLEYVKGLLNRFGIETTGPRIVHRRGTPCYSPRTGRRYKTKKDCYRLSIRTNSNLRFYKATGFTIERKRRRLEEYLRRRKIKPSPLSPYFQPNTLTQQFNRIVRGWDSRPNI